jgi:hypothetical protein
MTNRLVCGIAVFASLILGPPAALGQDTPAAPVHPSLARTFTKTIAGDLKSMVSADNMTVLSSPAALALVAAPFGQVGVDLMEAEVCDATAAAVPGGMMIAGSIQ